MPTKGACPIPGRVSTLRPPDAAARRPYHHSPLFRQRVDSFGQPKIKLSQSAFAMRRENQTHFVVTDVNVRMVLFIFRDLGHSIYKIDRIGKIIKLESAFDMFLLQFPFRYFFKTRLQLVRFHQISHNGTTSNIRKSFCNGKSSGFKYREFGADFWLNRKLRPHSCALASTAATNPATLLSRRFRLHRYPG